MKFRALKSSSKDLTITISDFSGGTMSLVDEAKMAPKFAKESVNLMQVQDGLWKTRWGTSYYGASHDSTLDGASEYVKSDSTTELVSISDGKAWKSSNGGTLTEITGATFTAGTQCYFMQIAGYLYIANGTDPLARYNGTTLSKYTEIAAPVGLTASLVASGLSSGTYVYYAQVTALNDVGETVGSTEASITTNKVRDNWTSTTDKIAWSWNTVATAARYQLYLADMTGYETLLSDADVTNFTDDGTQALNPYIEVPDANTTGAPLFKSMCVSSNRIWATNDSADLYKVYFSGTGQFIGNFSDFYGGGWINLEKGGRELPIAVKHYQSGSGEGRATVLAKTPDGRGAVWQLEITTATVGDTSFSVPSAVKVVGSFGTESILGVTNTTNNIEFPNRKGWFSLGPEKNYYGILRTNEQSSNIRPYWRNLAGSKMDTVCSYFYDAKVFISVATSTSGNDRIVVRDTERNNWSVDWTIGARQFLEYTDTSLVTHLLYIPLSGTKLIEISENYLNDLGVAFNQSYISPLLPVSKVDTDILNHKVSIVKLIRPRGSINFQLLGVGKDNNFTTLATSTISDFGSNTGVGTDLAGEQHLSETQVSVKVVTETAGGFTIGPTYTILTAGTTNFTLIGAADNVVGTVFVATGVGSGTGTATRWALYLLDAPSTYTQSITKKAIKKRAKIYALQFKVSSTTADTDFTILSLQAKGRLIPRRVPSAWTT